MSLEPYPSRDALVTKDGRATDEFDVWLSQNLQLAVSAAPSRVQSRVGDPDSPNNAAIGITPLGSVQIAGRYRLGSYVQIIRPDPVSNSVQVMITWTFNGIVQTETFAAVTGITTGTHQCAGLPLFHVDPGSPVSYTVTYASNTANFCRYTLDLVLELLQAD